jgi:hypothetical protein
MVILLNVAKRHYRSGATTMGVGLAGTLLQSDNHSFEDAKILLLGGAIIWVYGIVLTRRCNQFMK